jgi:transposase-like protein
MALVQRDGDVRVPMIPNVTAATLKGAIREHCDPSATISTDGLPSYRGLQGEFAAHWVVDHSAGEYARGRANTNSAESFFGLLKRGLVGTFHHVSKEHLPRYLDEFAFRWNGRKVKDVERTERALKQVEGKRLMFKSPEIQNPPEE